MNSVRTMKHLMLDLDETLICSSPLYTTLPKINVTIRDPEGRVWKSLPNVVIRPYLMEFLKALKPHYDLNIFTASDFAYAEAILCRIGIRSYFTKVYTRDDCSYVDGSHYKDLSKLPYPARDTILIDDRTNHLSNQSSQVLLIPPFTGESFDTHLQKLIPFLVELSKCSDLRPVSWKHIHYLERGCIPTKSSKDPFQRQSTFTGSSRKTRSSTPKDRIDSRKSDTFSKKALKKSMDSADEKRKAKKSFGRSNTVENKESGKVKVNHGYNIQNAAPSKFLLKQHLEEGALNQKEVFLSETTKAEENHYSDSTDEANVEEEDERAPSENPAVTRHLGFRKLKSRFIR